METRWGGRPLSVVGIVPDMVTDKEGDIAVVAAACRSRRCGPHRHNPSYYFIPVKTLPYGTPPEEIIRFQEMVDIGVIVRRGRVCPYGAAAAHTLAT
jgi:hypothetical protein